MDISQYRSASKGHCTFCFRYGHRISRCEEFSTRNEKLCKYCQGINAESITAPGGYRHAPNWITIERNASSCRLCAIIEKMNLAKADLQRRYAAPKVPYEQLSSVHADILFSVETSIYVSNDESWRNEEGSSVSFQVQNNRKPGSGRRLLSNTWEGE
jgi:hypothetical protein